MAELVMKFDFTINRKKKVNNYWNKLDVGLNN